jgi:hypothetical protein
MKRVSLAGTAAVISILAVPALAQEIMPRTEPGPDVHIKGSQGGIERGVRCATPGISREMAQAVDRAIAAARADGTIAAAPGGGISIPVVFHVIHNGTEGNVSNALVNAQVQVLNQAFQGTGFSFTLQSINRVLNKRWFTGCYSNQNFKKDLAVDPAHTLNFYTCKPKGNILGYAYLPWSYPESNYHHGVVVLYSTLPGGGAVPYDEGDTGTHEVGHYLGLHHTFEGGCTAPGDSVADTPFEASPAFGCPTGRNTCSQAGLDPITNFMDYTDDACMFQFSSGQSTRMSDSVATYKPSLGN